MSTPKRDRAEATRREVLRAARELFAERGYAATPLEEVAARAGVTKGAVYHHFGSKLGLFRAVFEDLEQELASRVVEAAARAPDPWEAIRSGVRAFLEACLDPAPRQVVLVDGPSVLGWEAWREIDERYGYAITKAALEAAMAAGAIAPRPPEPLARLFLAALSEAALQIARAPDTSRATQELGDAVLALLEGLRPGGAPPGPSLDTRGAEE